MLHLCDSLDRFFFMRIFQMKEQESIRNIKGIGEKTEKLLAKLGITTVGDFLRYYPREYDEYTEPVGVSQVTAGKKMCGYGKGLQEKVGRAKYRQTYHSDCHVKRRKFFLAAYVVQYAFFTQYLCGPAGFIFSEEW